MAHEIDMTVKGGAFAAVRVPAWHKLGVVTEEQVDALTLLKMAHADFDIFKTPVTTHMEHPETGEMLSAADPTKVNVCRIHPTENHLQILGQAGTDWQAWTPRDVLVGFGDAILDVAEPTVSAAGVLYEGRQVFMSFKLPEGILVGGLDRTDLWMTAHTSFDSSAATTLSVSPVRGVCANTVNMGLKSAIRKHRVTRRANTKLDIAQAREVLELTYAYAEEVQRIGNALVEKPMTNNDFHALINKLWGKDEDATQKARTAWEKTEGTLMDLFAKADTQENIRGTAWAGYNAVVEFKDHFATIKGTSDAAKGAGGDEGYRLWRGITSVPAAADDKDVALRAICAAVGVAL
ncbi:MAG: DUF932 domain-containing protein [Rhizobacter sp.]